MYSRAVKGSSVAWAALAVFVLGCVSNRPPVETHNSRKLRQLAGNAVRAGLPYDAALDSVTESAARAVGLGQTHGTVAPGYVANLVVWSGDPFELSTKVEAVVIRGQIVSLESRQTALFRRYR